MKKLATVIILILITAAIVIIWWSNMLLPVNSNAKTSTIFVVNKGGGVREIAYNLKAKGLVRNPIVFFLLLKKLGLDKKIEAGDFRLNPSMNTSDIAQTLTHGTLDIWVTIPEGLRAEEIAEILKDKIPTYKPFWKDVLIQKEGYLFPDTYLVPKNADIALIVSLMLKNFENKYAAIQPNEKNTLSKNDSVIVASLVEREARFPEDRILVASVMSNRLKIDMKLDIDATVQYALGYSQDEKTWWKKNLTVDDLAINSIYNTYKNSGLPPTPISNPGIDAIASVINAPKTDYLYYISDKSGRLHFAKTIEEHNANVKKYIL